MSDVIVRKDSHLRFSRPHTATSLLTTSAVSYPRRVPRGAGGGHVAGRITRAEWQEHSSNVSALIADDSAFCEHIQRMWGYDDGRTGSGDLSCKETPVRNKADPGGNSRNGTPIKPDAGHSSWGMEGKGDSPVCRGGNNDPSDKIYTSATGSTGPSYPPPPCVRFPRTAWGPQPAGEPEPTPFLGQQSATDTEVAVTTPAGILGLLGRARDSLVAGGLRGAFRLLKGFRGEDRGGSGKVTLSGFKAVLGEAELGLEEAEMRILFQVGSNSRQGVTAVLHHNWSRLEKNPHGVSGNTFKVVEQSDKQLLGTWHANRTKTWTG